jgi:multiple sugar transport system substrate-binding protein
MTQSKLTPSELLSRRSVLRGAALGAGVVAVPGLLAACSSGSSTGGSSGGGGTKQTITFGSNYSDPGPEKGIKAMVDAYQKKSGNTVKINKTEHNTYQQNITRYFQGNPDDVAAWFAGYRMQFFASKGYLGDISDVWSGLNGFSDALKAASTGADGKQYFVPLYNYIWDLFYRKSTFDSKGYKPPAKWDDFIALCKQIQKDGAVPLALCDKDGWPAMGTFDIINMRKNGYQFHVDLMAGKESWTSQKVKDVFGLWSTLFPYYQPGANGRTWEEAGTAFGKKEVAMVVFGTPHVALQAPTPADIDDSVVVAYPEIDPANGQDSLDAPIDGFVLTKKAKNPDGGKDFLKFIGTADAENAYLASDPTNIAVNSGGDTSKYNSLQKQSVEILKNTKHIAQYLDRDTRPDFAQTVMQSALQSFIDKHSPSDIDALCKNIDAQAKSIFAQPVS